jgi:hypothetical protein
MRSICRVAMLVHPRPTDVSPTENSWMLHPLDKVSLGYFAPDRTIPSPNFDFLIFLIIILGGLFMGVIDIMLG